MRIAVTGITGTIGLALGDLLERDDRISSVAGVARRPFDPASRGWGKVEFRALDVRHVRPLAEAFRDAEVVVHLAFSLAGIRQDRTTLNAVNVGGTLNAFRAAEMAGARRFVQASSAAVYGIEPGVSTPIPESAPLRPDPRHFYVQQKAQIELRLRKAAQKPRAPELTVLRPVGVAGPHATASQSRTLPRPLRTAASFAFGSGLRPPLLPPAVRMQFVHETDAARAFLRAALDGPPGTYNVAPDDWLEGSEVVRELGFPAVLAPRPLRAAALRFLADLPVPLPVWNWLQLVRSPYLLDTTAAKTDLGWAPEYGSREALASTRAAWSA
jgi:nucleoside-diphosphate-sugar epimerase